MANNNNTEAEYNRIIRDLQKKVYAPIYFLQGEEAYYIDLISNYIENNILTPDEKDFNQTVVYGKDTTIEDIVALAYRFPMMANYQVVIVKEAQNLPIGKNSGGKKNSDSAEEETEEEESQEDTSKKGKGNQVKALEKYFEKPQPTTILVFCYKYKTIPTTSKLLKVLSNNKQGEIFTSDKIADWDVNKWIENYLRNQNLSYDFSIPEMLGNYLGNDLQKIVNELNKLKKAEPTMTKVTADLIEKHIGISKHFNDFELIEAFGKRDLKKIFLIIDAYAKNPKVYPIQRTILLLFSFFKTLLLMYYVHEAEYASKLKINPYILKIRYIPAKQNYKAKSLIKIISLLREYDLKSKGLNTGFTDTTELLRELSLKIICC